MLSLGLDKLSRARSDILALAAQAAEVEADLKGQSVALDALVSDIAARTEVAKLDAARIDGELAVVAEEAREVQITLTEVRFLSFSLRSCVSTVNELCVSFL